MTQTGASSQGWPGRFMGTRERLALDRLLYSGLRRGDAVRVARPHVRNGRIRIERRRPARR
ncbi:hypothetical protein JOE48_004968 [Methylobacterium sp. PvR107]|nr:hypothetical protein [Methylobacterium sp. PvR107]